MPVNTYEKMFTKGPESALPATFDEGKIRFTVDTGRLFVDGQNGRTEISDFIKGMTEAEIKAQLAPLANKIYISSDTNKFMIYDNSVTGNWINIANSGQAQHADEADEAIHASTADYATNAGTAVYVTNGVRSIATGTANGTINVNINGSTSDITIKGLGSAAYTNSTAYIASSLKGANNGVAELDSAGKVPSSQLPSFVDDVKEYDSKTVFPATGEADKIYIAKDTDLCYRWSGTQYAEISPSLALGETSSTAYRGDRGKIAYDHSQSTHARTDATAVTSSSTNGNIKINGTETTVYTHPGTGTNPHGTTKSDIGLGSVANYDQSKAIKSITRSGTTFTATALDGTTSSFTQQDNNTTYTGANGITLSGTTFSNSGVRAIATGTTNGTINVNTNGSTANVVVKGLGDRAFDSTSYLPLAGGTLTGRTVFNNVLMPLSQGKVTNLSTATTELFKDGIAIASPTANLDLGWIRVTGTSETDTIMEIATGDDGIEQIVARQYNTSNAVVHEAKILDASGNSAFPGSVKVGGGCTLQYNANTQSLDFIFA